MEAYWKTRFLLLKFVIYISTFERVAPYNNAKVSTRPPPSHLSHSQCRSCTGVTATNTSCS